MLYFLQNINQELLVFLNTFAENKIIEQMVFLFSDFPILFLPLFFIFYWCFYLFHSPEKKISLLHIFYGTVFGIIIALFIQQFVHLQRPELFLENVGKLLLHHVPDASFPSDHATVSFAFITGLFLFGYKKIAWIYLPFVIVMNLSRTIAGVHWPFDIFVGAIIGILSGYFSFAIRKNPFSQKINNFILKIASFFKL